MVVTLQVGLAGQSDVPPRVRVEDVTPMLSVTRGRFHVTLMGGVNVDVPKLDGHIMFGGVLSVTVTEK